MLHPGIEHDLPAYAHWVSGIWMGNPDGLDARDHAIMSLGLGGEMGEVAELIELAPLATAIDRRLAIKELGDVIYYWHMLANAFDLDPRACWSSALPAGTILDQSTDAAALQLVATTDPDRSLPLLGIALSARTGVVLEQLKKRVRDDHFDPERFTRAMGAMAVAWCALVHHLGLLPSQVLRANIDKVEDRAARGVLRGSGNDR